MVALALLLLAGLAPGGAGKVEVRLVPGFGGRARLERLGPVSVYLANAGPDIDASLVVLCGGQPVRREVELPRGSKKLFRLGCLLEGAQAQAVLTAEGEQLERRSVPVIAVPEEMTFCAWVGRTGAGLSTLRSEKMRWAVVKPEELPEHAVLYEALDALVFACSPEDLEERQKQALRAWAESGGRVAYEGPRPRFLDGCEQAVPLIEFRPPRPPPEEEEKTYEELAREVGLDRATETLSKIMELRYPSVGWLAGVLFLMAFVLTPAEYFVLKKLKKLHLSWWIFGAEIAVFCAGTYLWTWSVLGSTMSAAEVAIADPLPSGQERVRGLSAAFVPAATTVEFVCPGLVWSTGESTRPRYGRSVFVPGTVLGTVFEEGRTRLSLRATQWSQVAARFDVLRPSPPAPKIERTRSGGAPSWRIDAPEDARCWAVYRGNLYSLNASARRYDNYRACASLVRQLVAEGELLPPGCDPKKDAVILVVRREPPVCAVVPAPQKADAFLVRRYVDKGE